MKFDPSSLPKGFIEEWERRRAFHKAVRNIFGLLNVASGSIKDDFGGELFYAYYYPADRAEETNVDRHVRQRFADHKKLVNSLLPEIKAKRPRSVSDKISQAIRDLNTEDLAPLFQATGKKWKSKVIHYRGSEDEVERLEKEELVDGTIRRTRLKQLRPGRPPRVKSTSEKKRDRTDFEQRIREAVHGLISTGTKITKTNIARFLNCGGDDTRLSALNGKLKRLGITNSRYEKVVANAISEVNV